MSVDALQLVKTLEEKSKTLDFVKNTEDAPIVAERCEYTYRSFEDARDQVESFVSRVEQGKGIVKGLGLAIQLVAQHKDILRAKCEKEEITKDKLWELSEIVDKCGQSIKDAFDKQQQELIRVAGKAEGSYDLAIKTLDRIQGYLTNLDQQRRFMKDNPTFEGRETTPRNGDNGEPKVEEVVKKRGRPKKVAKA